MEEAEYEKEVEEEEDAADAVAVQQCKGDDNYRWGGGGESNEESEHT